LVHYYQVTELEIFQAETHVTLIPGTGKFISFDILQNCLYENCFVVLRMAQQDADRIAHKMDTVQGIYQIFFFDAAASIDGINEIIVLKKPEGQEWFLRSLSDFPDVNENGLPCLFVFHLSKAYNFFDITNLRQLHRVVEECSGCRFSQKAYSAIRI
jgi:hypothetical protein